VYYKIKIQYVEIDNINATKLIESELLNVFITNSMEQDGARPPLKNIVLQLISTPLLVDPDILLPQRKHATWET
jgi:hypothetical protein